MLKVVLESQLTSNTLKEVLETAMSAVDQVNARCIEEAIQDSLDFIEDNEDIFEDSYKELFLKGLIHGRFGLFLAEAILIMTTQLDFQIVQIDDYYFDVDGDRMTEKDIINEAMDHLEVLARDHQMTPAEFLESIK